MYCVLLKAGLLQVAIAHTEKENLQTFDGLEVEGLQDLRLRVGRLWRECGSLKDELGERG